MKNNMARTEKPCCYIQKIGFQRFRYSLFFMEENMKYVQKLRKVLLGVALLSLATVFGSAHAATSVSWLTPADNSVYPTGTNVSPTGVASGTGTTGGTGLDLVLVLDSSGSMSLSGGGGLTRSQWQAQAAIALVNSLPTGTTSVSIVEFDSDANLVTGLTSLIPVSNIAVLEAAINGVNASGGTNIGSGIRLATSELTGANHTVGRTQMMLVLSDGSTSGNPAIDAADAVAAGVDAVHSVGIPGHNVSTMQSIAAAGNGVYTDVSDLTTITGIFDGTGGSLVGLAQVDVEMPDGTILTNVATDALGNFQVGPYGLATGANTFVATATGTDGTTATDTLTLYGVAASGVPDSGGLALLLIGLLGLIGGKKIRRD